MTSPVAPLDLIATDHLLSEEERSIRDTVRAYCDAELRPHVADWFEAGDLPARDIARGLGELGVLVVGLPRVGVAVVAAVAAAVALRTL